MTMTIIPNQALPGAERRSRRAFRAVVLRAATSPVLIDASLILDAGASDC